MNFRKTVITSLIMASILNSQVNAHEKISVNSMEDRLKSISINKKELVNDIQIKWLNENTIFYIGADMPIDACVNEEASEKNIIWRVNDLDNKSNVIKLNSKENNKAILEAMKEGRAEIMALAMDDSDATREITVNVKDYSTDDPNKLLISHNIIPIQSRNISQDKKMLQVEVKRDINYNEKINAIDTYLSKLAKLGQLTSEKTNLEHEDYEFYTINNSGLNEVEIEVRLDKKDDSYSYIKDKLINIDQIDGLDEQEELDKDETLPEKPPIDENDLEEENEESDNDLTDKIDKIIILGGEGTEDNPIYMEVNKNLTSKEKIDAMSEYLQLLQQSKNLEVIDIKETSKYSAYKIKVSEKMSKNKNDFYIEIIVDKEDKESYKAIISMLNKINKSDKENINSNNDGSSEAQSEDKDFNKNDINESNNKEEHTNTDDGTSSNSVNNESEVIEINSANKEKEYGNESKYNTNLSTEKDDKLEKINDEKIKDNNLKKEYSINKGNSSKYILTTAAGTFIGGIAIGRINKRKY